jgi:hypothetical protein
MRVVAHISELLGVAGPFNVGNQVSQNSMIACLGYSLAQGHAGAWPRKNSLWARLFILFDSLYLALAT